MKKTILLFLLITIPLIAQPVNFDDPSKWTQGSGPFNSYQNDHKYEDFVNGHGNSNSPKEYAYIDKTIGESGKYIYRLKQVDVDGLYEYSQIVEVYVGAPEKFELSQNYPNPFNTATTIKYTLTPSLSLGERVSAGQVRGKIPVSLKVYDIFGRETITPVNKNPEITV